MITLDSPEAQSLLAQRYKLAFFDIDGTLLGLDGNYTARVKDAVLALRAAGVKTAVASGRPKFAAEFLIRELQLQDVGVFYTGALIEQPNGQILACYPLKDSMIQTLVTEAQALQLHTEIYGQNEYFVGAETELSVLHSQHLRSIPTYTNLMALVGQFPVIKLLFASTTPAEHEKLLALEARHSELHFAYAKMAAKPDWTFASVISQQACKHNAFDQLLEHHQVTAAEVMSFGDAHSDMIFLERAGLGVALGNAPEEVKSVASLVTYPVWQDGIAEVIERHLALQPLAS